MGRWRSGAPLVQAPEQDREDLKRYNAFSYHDTDPHGFACPVGSHVRRANPRDSLDPKHPRTALRSTNRHRILRRGRPYGPPFFAARPDGEEAERGLLFLALNSDIERQFEFVQQQWINNPNFGGLQGEGDPLLSPSEVFTEPQDPVRRRITGLKRFITVKGGAYFFLPGLRALKYFASLPG
jgi:Dyp-type peroxidase family